MHSDQTKKTTLEFVPSNEKEIQKPIHLDALKNYHQREIPTEHDSVVKVHFWSKSPTTVFQYTYSYTVSKSVVYLDTKNHDLMKNNLWLKKVTTKYRDGRKEKHYSLRESVESSKMPFHFIKFETHNSPNLQALLNKVSEISHKRLNFSEESLTYSIEFDHTEHYFANPALEGESFELKSLHGTNRVLKMEHVKFNGAIGPKCLRAFEYSKFSLRIDVLKTRTSFLDTFPQPCYAANSAIIQFLHCNSAIQSYRNILDNLIRSHRLRIMKYPQDEQTKALEHCNLYTQYAKCSDLSGREVFSLEEKNFRDEADYYLVDISHQEEGKLTRERLLPVLSRPDVLFVRVPSKFSCEDRFGDVQKKIVHLNHIMLQAHVIETTPAMKNRSKDEIRNLQNRGMQYYLHHFGLYKIFTDMEELNQAGNQIIDDNWDNVLTGRKKTLHRMTLLHKHLLSKIGKCMTQENYQNLITFVEYVTLVMSQKGNNNQKLQWCSEMTLLLNGKFLDFNPNRYWLEKEIQEIRKSCSKEELSDSDSDSEWESD